MNPIKKIRCWLRGKWLHCRCRSKAKQTIKMAEFYSPDLLKTGPLFLPNAYHVELPPEDGQRRIRILKWADYPEESSSGLTEEE